MQTLLRSATAQISAENPQLLSLPTGLPKATANKYELYLDLEQHETDRKRIHFILKTTLSIYNA